MMGWPDGERPPAPLTAAAGVALLLAFIVGCALAVGAVLALAGLL